MTRRPIPWDEFDAEVALVRHLLREIPWRRSSGEDRALRAAYRRWTTADEEPSPLMLQPLWARVPAGGWHGLADDGLDRAVHHAALLLHLVALGEGGTGRPVDNLGAAAKAANLAEGRFARLVNTPEPARLTALARLFRRFARENVNYRPIAPAGPEQAVSEDAERAPAILPSTRATLRDSRRDDLAALLAFLFTNDPKTPASRWAAGYYNVSLTPTAAEAA